MIQSDLNININGEEIIGRYKQTSGTVILLTMLKPYYFCKTVTLEDSCTHLNREQLDDVVKEKLIWLYDILKMVEEEKDKLIDLLTEFNSFNVKLAETELRHNKNDEKITAEQLNDAVDVLAEEYYRNLFEQYFDVATSEIKRLQKIDPFFLQLLLRAVELKRKKNFEVERHKETLVEYEDENIKGEFLLRLSDGDYGYSMDILKPFSAHLPAKWDNSLSRLKTPSEIKEFAEKCFQETTKVIEYISTNRDSCQKLFDETRQFWDALIDVQLDDNPRIVGYEDFMILVKQKYFEIECDKYIADNEEVKRIILERGLAFLQNILMELNENENGYEY